MTISLRERNKQSAMAAVRTTACDLMAERGFAQVTVEEIATVANISPSTLYRYFGTKEALVLAADRPQQLVSRLAKDTSDRSATEAFQRAACKVWEASDATGVELSLIAANPELSQARERQLLDQRDAIAEVFAERRQAKSSGLRDQAAAAACLAILATVLSTQEQQKNAKPLAKLLAKSFSTICE